MLVDRIREAFVKIDRPAYAAEIGATLPDVCRVTLATSLRTLVTRGLVVVDATETMDQGGTRARYRATQLFLSSQRLRDVTTSTRDLVVDVLRESSGLLSLRDIRRLVMYAYGLRVALPAFRSALSDLERAWKIVVTHNGRMAMYQLAGRALPAWQRLDVAMRRMTAEVRGGCPEGSSRVRWVD